MFCCDDLLLEDLLATSLGSLEALLESGDLVEDAPEGGLALEGLTLLVGVGCSLLEPDLEPKKQIIFINLFL